MKKKRKDAAWHRRRMRRKARLADARQWLPAQQGMEGMEVLDAYERWYGVDRLCAITELRLLGVVISEEIEAQVREAHVQSEKARSAERAAKRAERQRAEQQRAAVKRAEKQREEQLRAAAKRAAKRAKKQRPVGASIGGAGPFDTADAREWTSWAEAGIDAECRAMAGDVPDRSDGYAGCSIEDALFEAARVVEPRVIEAKIETEIQIETKIETEIQIETKTTIETPSGTKTETKTTIETKTESEIKRLEGRRVHVRIVLEADPAVLARHAWGLIFAISALSFADADADVDFINYHEWSADDMLRCLAFDRGRLRFAADHVHGRCMQTTIEIDGEGKITLETVNRGEAATRWIAKLRRKPAAPMIEAYLGDGDDGDAREPIPF